MNRWGYFWMIVLAVVLGVAFWFAALKPVIGTQTSPATTTTTPVPTSIEW